jgi:hypothetical protein
MKRFFYFVAAMMLATTAAFADGLSRQVGAEASRLLVEVDGARKLANARPALKPQPLTPTLVTDLQRFGLAASRLSLEIDARGGPEDLKCIFRGMAEETGKQLAAVSSAATGAQQAMALSRLSLMLSDAARIAPAADGPAAQKQTAADSSSAAANSCPVVRNF